MEQTPDIAGGGAAAASTPLEVYDREEQIHQLSLEVDELLIRYCALSARAGTTVDSLHRRVNGAQEVLRTANDISLYERISRQPLPEARNDPAYEAIREVLDQARRISTTQAGGSVPQPQFTLRSGGRAWDYV